MTTDYDIITMGGGLGGASFAKGMASAGHKVLVIEREAAFKDRVRGEWIAPWGVAEARKLGLFDALDAGCAHQVLFWDTYAGPMPLPRRNLKDEIALNEPPMTFFHPGMQETILGQAALAGADVRRGAAVRAIEPGATPKVRIESNDKSEDLTARLVVADGRNSSARKWGGFTSKQDPPGNFLAGVLIENVASPPEASIAVFNPAFNQLALIFPQAGGTVRGYFGARIDSGKQMSGDADFPAFIEESVRTGMPGDYYANAKRAGPLATFDGADSWVEHPYTDGLALLGDAAAASDQDLGPGNVPHPPRRPRAP